MTLGKTIQAARKRAGLTQVELGERLGVSRSMISHWETELRKPTTEIVGRIAEGLWLPAKENEMIKDSGQRTIFSTGSVRDLHEGKGRMDLLPWAAIMEVSKHCENGSVKYGEHNVDKGIPTHSLCDSAARHLAKYLDGWDDEPHLLAATWNLLWAVQMELKHPELVDTPWKDGESND